MVLAHLFKDVDKVCIHK